MNIILVQKVYSLERKCGIPHSSIKNWYYNFYKKGINILELKEKRVRKKEEDIDYKERYEILKKYQAFLKHNETESNIYISDVLQFVYKL